MPNVGAGMPIGGCQPPDEDELDDDDVLDEDDDSTFDDEAVAADDCAAEDIAEDAALEEDIAARLDDEVMATDEAAFADVDATDEDEDEDPLAAVAPAWHVPSRHTCPARHSAALLQRSAHFPCTHACSLLQLSPPQVPRGTHPLENHAVVDTSTAQVHPLAHRNVHLLSRMLAAAC